MVYVPIFQVLKLFQVVCFNEISMAFRCPVLVPDTASVKAFCIISVQVPVNVPVLDTASVITPLKFFNLIVIFTTRIIPSDILGVRSINCLMYVQSVVQAAVAIIREHDLVGCGAADYDCAKVNVR